MSSSSGSENGKAIYRREELVGKQVVSQEAKIIGMVKDIALSTDGKVVLQVETKGSSDTMLAANMISVVGDVILLKSSEPDAAASDFPTQTQTAKEQSHSRVSPPPFPGAPSNKYCTKCGYGNSMNSRFCIKCGAPLH